MFISRRSSLSIKRTQWHFQLQNTLCCLMKMTNISKLSSKELWIADCIKRNSVYILCIEDILITLNSVTIYDTKAETQRVCLRIVYADKEKSSYEFRNCLIFKVDQPGLEPGTSRLWVCCSNQLSYKSELNGFLISECKSRCFPWNYQENKSHFFIKRFNQAILYHNLIVILQSNSNDKSIYGSS